MNQTPCEWWNEQWRRMWAETDDMTDFLMMSVVMALFGLIMLLLGASVVYGLVQAVRWFAEVC